MHGIFAASDPEFISTENGYSFFFDLIRGIWTGTNCSPLHRICTLMRKMGVKSLVKEQLQIAGELEEEREDVSIRTGGAVTAEAFRITFFSRPREDNEWRAFSDSDVLGYAVVLKLVLSPSEARTYVMESVVRLPRMDVNGQQTTACVPNYYIHCCRTYKTTVGSTKEAKEFNIKGAFFCQQNDMTHVCAHASLRMALNSLPSQTAKVTNRLINSILQIDHIHKKVGKIAGEHVSIGLCAAEIKQVASSQGWGVQFADFLVNPQIDYQDFVYSIIESGYPVILGIHAPGIAHVVAIQGHTLNTDRWSPEARNGYGGGWPKNTYIPVTAWVDHFLVADDNYGMYTTLPTDSVRNFLLPKYNPNLHASLAIGLMPSDVTVAPSVAASWGIYILEKLIQGTSSTPNNRWFNLLKKDWWVPRTLLQDKDKYIPAIQNLSDQQGNKLTPDEISLLETNLPNRFWVTEITLPNLYTGNKRKLGEIIGRADASDADFQNGKAFVFAWLPMVHWIADAHANITAKDWSFSGHIPILRAACEDCSEVEW